MAADPSDVMVIVAHPDDAEFGAAGAVAGWVRDGKRVVYLVCTSGEKGTGNRSVLPEDLAIVREKEQGAAAELLGVKEVVFLRCPDQALEETPEFRKEIVRQIRIYQPEIVVSMDPYKRYIWHRDHRIIGQVVLDAVFPYARDHLAYPDLLAEGLEPHKVKELLFFGAENINYHIDITDTFKAKVAALLCHESQIKEMGIPDFESWLRKRCRQLAAGSEFELAEAFHRVVTPA